VEPEAKAEPAKMTVDGDEEAAPGGDASFEARAVAAIIDSFVAGGIFMVIGILSDGLAGMVMIAYLLTRDALPFLEGQSLGKKLMKLRAVSMDGKKLTGDWQASILRNIPIAIPFFGLVEAYILYSRQGREGPLQRLGDEWGKTRVVTVPGPGAL
jgi:uncharacterized RDD family membrane protein YckC